MIRKKRVGRGEGRSKGAKWAIAMETGCYSVDLVLLDDLTSPYHISRISTIFCITGFVVGRKYQYWSHS
jgi:hypothetical protein